MENDSNEAQLNKIRALLAKAEATNFPEEAETYTAKAMELISKWGIDQSLLEAKTKTSTIVDRKFQVVAPFARDKVTFLFVVVSALGGRAVWLKNRANKGFQELHVFATETDMNRIDMLFTSLLVQCSSAMNHAVSVSWEARHQPRKFKSDFLYGFSNEVGYRLGQAEKKATREAETTAAAQGTSTALVLKSKKEKIDDRVDEVYRSLTNARRSNRIVGGGYGHGLDAGKRADIGGKSAKQGALVG